MVSLYQLYIKSYKPKYHFSWKQLQFKKKSDFSGPNELVYVNLQVSRIPMIYSMSMVNFFGILQTQVRKIPLVGQLVFVLEISGSKNFNQWQQGAARRIWMQWDAFETQRYIRQQQQGISGNCESKGLRFICSTFTITEIKITNKDNLFSK